MKVITRPVVHLAKCLATPILILLFGFSSIAKTADINPLRPIDASSPRATLQGFVEIMDETYRGLASLFESYAASDRLYGGAQAPD